ncbi:39S ribosomal protein L37, mitochondrial [Brienomyrus brachyistius]|uniref:39S ribosomal protein L37, mitochondrial n=1 Tax=Brienomyrus brachyistius TaxID=42636 RepID=UPI0020B27AAD|nr:39S ribosomal protein L37, mitochondrial [Brienomyrus brachyistius]
MNLLVLTLIKAGKCSSGFHISHVSRHRVGARLFSVSCCLHLKAPPRTKRKAPVDIPGVERVTYAERLHFVPGLAKPTFPQWSRGWRDPHRYSGPEYEGLPPRAEKPCFVFNQRTSALEGTRQAAWLTKSIVRQGLPPQILALAEDAANQIEDQDERVQHAIQHARFWDSTERKPPRERFCPVLLRNLLHLCGTLQVRLPALGRRMLAEKYSLAACWSRGGDLFQVRGQNGLLLNSMSAVPVVAGKEELRSTEGEELETFYPIAPTIDLQVTHTYKQKNDKGFQDGYPYPHAHTLYILECGEGPKLKEEQVHCKMIMFAFGNALAHAHALYGTQPQVLERPVTVQSVATNGRTFSFVVFQLNTTDLDSDTGVKNLVWMDADQPLYEYAKIRPVVKRKVIQVPAGLAGYQPDTFKRFLALYLHGAACPASA